MTSTMQVIICALLMTITALVHYIHVVSTDYNAQCIVASHTALQQLKTQHSTACGSLHFQVIYCYSVFAMQLKRSGSCRLLNQT